MTNTTVRAVSCPGPELPAVPSFSLDLPENYLAHSAPGLLAVCTPKDQSDIFQPNLTVAAGLVPAGTTATALIDSVVAGLKADHPGVTFGNSAGVDGVVLAESLHARVPVAGTEVEQVITAYVVREPVPGGYEHSFTVTSSWRAGDPAGEQLREIHVSFRITGLRTAS